MSQPNPYQPPEEESEPIRPPVKEDTVFEQRTVMQEALYFLGVAGVVFLLTFGFVIVAKLLRDMVLH